LTYLVLRLSRVGFRNSGPSTRMLKQRVAGVEDYGCNPDDLKHVRGKVAVIEEGGPCELWDVAHHAEKVCYAGG